MGGIGSGRRFHYHTKQTADSVKSIDIGYLNKHGLLEPDMGGRLSWSNRGKKTGEIIVGRMDDHVLLDYRVRMGGGEWQKVSELVKLDQTPCNYGGHRHWFRCPECSRRVGKLYAGGVRFLCRKCYKLPYDSQMKGDLDRLLNKKHALGERIFEDYSTDRTWKKKGLHHKTFNRLYKEYKELEDRWGRGVLGSLGLPVS